MGEQSESNIVCYEVEQVKDEYVEFYKEAFLRIDAIADQREAFKDFIN
jgi:hypothetical protein